MRPDRLAYWNSEYASYWLQRVAEADRDTSGTSQLVESDSKTADMEGLHTMLDVAPIKAGQRVLDVACGFGRAFPYFLGHGVEIVGTDLSNAMLNITPPSLKGDERVRMVQAEAENMPFVDGSFDAVVVIAAFEAFEQHLALPEMLRVCRPQGHLLLAGKNSRYRDDDEQALVAERNARRKGHPNYFTDFNALLRGLDPAASIERVLYFVRREDIAPVRYVEQQPREFYMYLALARRTDTPAPRIREPIASEISVTWERCGVTIGE